MRRHRVYVIIKTAIYIYINTPLQRFTIICIIWYVDDIDVAIESMPFTPTKFKGGLSPRCDDNSTPTTSSSVPHTVATVVAGVC